MTRRRRLLVQVLKSRRTSTSRNPSSPRAGVICGVSQCPSPACRNQHHRCPGAWKPRWPGSTRQHRCRHGRARCGLASTTACACQHEPGDRPRSRCLAYACFVLGTWPARPSGRPAGDGHGARTCGAGRSGLRRAFDLLGQFRDGSADWARRGWAVPTLAAHTMRILQRAARGERVREDVSLRSSKRPNMSRASLACDYLRPTRKTPLTWPASTRVTDLRCGLSGISGGGGGKAIRVR